MNILVIMHVASEGPGTLGTFFRSLGARITTARLYEGDSLPFDPAAYGAIVSMGGPMNVYEEAEYPFLKQETDFLRSAVSEKIPVIGICLGAQMIAKAAGAAVVKSPEKEIGWGSVTLTDAGKSDRLFQGLPETLDVLQWHGDMFHIPAGGTLLASSNACPHQAFRIENAFGLQFHLEVDAPILDDWFADLAERDEILRRYHELEPILVTRAQQLYENFASLLR